MRQQELDANRRLAEALGWTGIFNVGGALLGTPPTGAPQCRNQARVPDWTGRWEDCGSLMAEHVLAFQVHDSCAVITALPDFNMVRARSEGEGDDRLLRHAIVDAVTAKLLVQR